MLRSYLIIVFLAMLAVTVAQSVKPGDCVRLATAEHPNVRGSVTELTAETIVVDSLRLPLGSVTRLDVRQSETKTWEGTLIGAVVGAGFGALAFLDDDDEPCTGYLCARPPDIGPGYIVAGVILGAIAGTAIKAGKKWRRVDVDRLSFNLGPQREGGVALGMSLRF